MSCLAGDATLVRSPWNLFIIGAHLWVAVEEQDNELFGGFRDIRPGGARKRDPTTEDLLEDAGLGFVVERDVAR